MHAPCVRIDVARQCIGVGGLELGDLPPFENLLRQRMAELGQLVEHARAGRPLAGLGLGAARQPHLAEQDVAKLFRAARIEFRLTGQLADVGFQRSAALGEFAGETRQRLPIDRNAAPLHAGQHGRERPLQRLVDRVDPLGRQPRLEHVPEPQDQVGALGGIFGRLVDHHTVEGDARFAGADQRRVIDGGMIEVAGRKLFEIMAGAAGIQHVGDQQRVVVRRNLDAALGKNQPVELGVLPDLEDALDPPAVASARRARPTSLS